MIGYVQESVKQIEKGQHSEGEVDRAMKTARMRVAQEKEGEQDKDNDQRCPATFVSRAKHERSCVVLWGLC
jgi:hypothetical protein